MTSGRGYGPKAVVLRRKRSVGERVTGIAPRPAEDLAFRGGRVLSSLSFKTFYVGKTWTDRAGDMKNIDESIAAAMSDPPLNDIVGQYFGGHTVTTSALPSTVISTQALRLYNKEAIERLVGRLFKAGSLAGLDLSKTVVNFVLSPGAILSDAGGAEAKLPVGTRPPGTPEDEAEDSEHGLGGYHGSVHLRGAGATTTIYYAVAVWSEGQNGIAVPGWQPWENVVATLYHELNEARTDPDVEDAIRTGDLRWIGWNSDGGSEIGDVPIEEAEDDLTLVFKKVPIAAAPGVVPIQLLWSNRVHGPEEPSKPGAAADDRARLSVIQIDSVEGESLVGAAAAGAIRFSPPANLTDFKKAPSAAQWSSRVSGLFDVAIAGTQAYLKGLPSQFFNPGHGTPSSPGPVEQVISWQGFPRTVEQKTGVGTTETWKAAEAIHGSVVGRHLHQDEYLEWFVTRNAAKKIIRIDFTCEGPEYWEFLAENEPEVLLNLYQTHIDKRVQLSDLIVDAEYQSLNLWNLTRGAMHLIQPANSLEAEVQIAGDATILRKDANGTLLTDAQALIKCAEYGVATRASDPHIGDLVNGLARQGYVLALKDPVGLYMSRPNLDGFTTPDGAVVTQDWFQITRGNEKYPVRASFQAPKGGKHVVGDIKIGGIPLAWGGQVAKVMQMSLTGVAYGKGTIDDPSFRCGPASSAAAITAVSRVRRGRVVS